MKQQQNNLRRTGSTQLQGAGNTQRGSVRSAPRRSTGTVPHRSADRMRGKVFHNSEPKCAPAGIIERFNGWRLGISIDGESVLKGVVIGALMILFTLLQTTFFARFRPFGAIPDLMLPFAVAVGTLEKEKWGAVTALVAAFFIDAAGGTEIMLLPLLYVPSAYAVGILTTHRFRDSFPVIVMYTVITSVLRGVVTFIIATVSVHGIAPAETLTTIVLPELGANLLLAAFPQILTRLCLRPFHKTRAQRTGDIKI